MEIEFDTKTYTRINAGTAQSVYVAWGIPTNIGSNYQVFKSPISGIQSCVFTVIHDVGNSTASFKLYRGPELAIKNQSVNNGAWSYGESTSVYDTVTINDVEKKRAIITDTSAKLRCPMNRVYLVVSAPSSSALTHIEVTCRVEYEPITVENSQLVTKNNIQDLTDHIILMRKGIGQNTNPFTDNISIGSIINANHLSQYCEQIIALQTTVKNSYGTTNYTYPTILQPNPNDRITKDYFNQLVNAYYPNPKS